MKKEEVDAVKQSGQHKGCAGSSTDQQQALRPFMEAFGARAVMVWYTYMSPISTSDWWSVNPILFDSFFVVAKRLDSMCLCEFKSLVLNVFGLIQ
jgi:hypothetical protein